MTSSLRCIDGRCIRRFQINMAAEVMTCVAPKFGITCPKAFNRYQLLQECWRDHENLTPNATDMETYRP